MKKPTATVPVPHDAQRKILPGSLASSQSPLEAEVLAHQLSGERWTHEELPSGKHRKTIGKPEENGDLMVIHP